MSTYQTHTLKPFRIRPMDRRFTGYGTWAWIVDVHGDLTVAGRWSNRTIVFNRMRDWCWQTWGASCERDAYLNIREQAPQQALNPHWVWNTEFSHHSLYLKTDADLTLFELKWS